MKMLKLAAGFAAGYVLGSRAGREKYEQIAATARKLQANPTVIQAQEKAKTLLGAASDKAAGLTGTTPRPRAPKPPTTEPVSVTTPAVVGDPLV
ncbi:hypothetical protein [Actinoplanes sp. NPDC026619]|uniref:hypothetical protein n=1 Tax=Actinoplanes sp. NPDC026619 TaxID=3155798 RepID=UPI0033E4FEA8